MTQPYRAAPPAEPSRPRELVVRARERDRNAAFHRVWIGTGLCGLFGAMLCSALGLAAIGWVPLVVAFVWFFVSWRRTVRGSAIALRVNEGQLTVTAGARTLLDLPLRSLLDVQLDTTTITPVVRKTGVEVIAGESTTRGGGAVDISRVLLVPMEPRAPVSVSEDQLAHMDAVEMASQIRRFLRAHAWLPADEREAPAGEG
jgi:hypothetical protein